MIAIMSGRFDVLHPAHLKQIALQASRVDMLYVLVWDGTPPPDTGRVYPVAWTIEILNAINWHEYKIKVCRDPRLVHAVEAGTVLDPVKYAEIRKEHNYDGDNIKIWPTSIHFGYCTAKELASLPPHDVFLVGNPAVAEQMKSLGENVKTYYEIEGFHSSDIKSKIKGETQ